MRSRPKAIVLSVLAITIAAGSAAWGDLVAWWKFDETSGSVAADSSGNGVDGVFQGAVAIGNDAERGPVFQQNDAIANYISIPDPRGLLNFSATGPHQGSATTMAWVKSNGNWTSHDTIFNQGEWDDGIGLSIKGDTSPAGQLWLHGDGAHAVSFRSNVAVPTNSWHHVAATFAYDGTNTVVTFYLDGQPTAFSEGDGHLSGRVSAPLDGISRIGLEDGPGDVARWPFNGSIDDVVIFDTALSQAEVQVAMRGIRTQRGAASNPTPTDGADDVLCDVVLSWSVGEFAATHDVYFGTSFDDVNSATIDQAASAGQDANWYDPPGLLRFGQMYYWRVDEVNAPPTSKVFAGDVWSFEVEPYAELMANVQATASSSFKANSVPGNTVNGSGLTELDDPNDTAVHGITDGTMWLSQRNAPGPAWILFEFDNVYKLDHIRVWNFNSNLERILKVGVKDVIVEYATDTNDWKVVPNVQPFAQAPGAAGYASDIVVDFGGAEARYVRLNPQSNFAGTTSQFGLSEVRFYYVPVRARQPKPDPGSTGIDPEVVLSWRAGREAASHQLYLSADSNAVAEGTALVGTVQENRYRTDDLNLKLGETYHWKVVEVNQAASPPTWDGDIWSFSTVQYLVVDDMESYRNEPFKEIWATWLDGTEFGTNDPTNGSIVGVDPAAGDYNAGPGRSGGQSLPIWYNNTTTPRSEVLRTFPSPWNWTAHGADTLTLYLRGTPAGFVQLSPTHILMNGVGIDIYGTSDQGRFVYKQLSGDGSIIARVIRLDNTDPIGWAKAGVMIRRSLDAGSSWALGLASSTNGARFQARLTIGGGATSDTTLNATPTPLPQELMTAQIPVWLKLERKGDLFSVYYATGETPTNWILNPWSPQTIIMGDPVYIGLAVTSHIAGVVTQAEFTDIATTGNVTGAWESASLGIEQPAGNLPDAFYIAVEDTTGQKATVVHTDPLAVATGTWTPWNIPLSRFLSAGVKTDSIKKMTIGVGDKAKPASKATGLIYIDDIAFGRASQ